MSVLIALSYAVKPYARLLRESGPSSPLTREERRTKWVMLGIYNAEWQVADVGVHYVGMANGGVPKTWQGTTASLVNILKSSNQLVPAAVVVGGILGWR